MIIKAKQSFIQYVEKSADFLNCPTFIFNDHLNGVYRQFIMTDGKNETIRRLAQKLYTFDYSKKEAWQLAEELFNYYENTPHQEFVKLNKNWDVIPERMEQRNKEISDYIERGTQYYPNGIVEFIPSYPFKKGYKLKDI